MPVQTEQTRRVVFARCAIQAATLRFVSGRRSPQPPGTISVSSSGGAAVHGAPADCVRLGLLKVAPDAKWILSGINHGANLGADVHYSGTVAAVREAVLHGWPGIAVSHYRKSGVAYDWKRAAEWVTPILVDLLARPVEP